MGKIHVMDHPLIAHKISYIRRADVGTKEFREVINEIAQLMCYEATRDLKLKDVKIRTPIAETVGKELAGRKPAIIPILRAGVGMVDGMLSLMPAAKVGHIGLYRDPETLEPVEYYCKLPSDCEGRVCGGSDACYRRLQYSSDPYAQGKRRKQYSFPLHYCSTGRGGANAERASGCGPLYRRAG